jgi:UDP-glucose 4-epimerase
MKVSLVTGGAGFIGAHVTNELLKLGHKVIVLDDLSGGFRENVNPEAIQLFLKNFSMNINSFMYITLQLMQLKG